MKKCNFLFSQGVPPDGTALVSPEVLKALLERRKSGKLANSSTLKDWVNRLFIYFSTCSYSQIF